MTQTNNTSEPSIKELIENTNEVAHGEIIDYRERDGEIVSVAMTTESDSDGIALFTDVERDGDKLKFNGYSHIEEPPYEEWMLEEYTEQFA